MIRVVDCAVCSEAVDTETGIGLMRGEEQVYIHEWCVPEYVEYLIDATESTRVGWPSGKGT